MWSCWLILWFSASSRLEIGMAGKSPDHIICKWVVASHAWFPEGIPSWSHYIYILLYIYIYYILYIYYIIYYIYTIWYIYILYIYSHYIPIIFPLCHYFCSSNHLHPSEIPYRWLPSSPAARNGPMAWAVASCEATRRRTPLCGFQHPQTYSWVPSGNLT